jgi:hypothetical protein
MLLNAKYTVVPETEKGFGSRGLTQFYLSNTKGNFLMLTMYCPRTTPSFTACSDLKRDCSSRVEQSQRMRLHLVIQHIEYLLAAGSSVLQRLL